MNNKNMWLACALAGVCLMSGCTHTYIPGSVYDVQEIDFAQEFKKGEACESYFMLFGPFGEASILKAAKNYRINKVKLVERKITAAFLGRKDCVIVYGS